MRTFASIDDLAAAVGETVGPGPWQTVDQSRVDLFADATDDHQWIHVDPRRAAAGPFGGTIAHGYLTLSLLPALVGRLCRVEGVGMGVNYGLNRVRFPAPVRVGSAVRASATIAEVSPVDGGLQVVTVVTVECDAGGKPACVAETVSRLYRSAAR
ncbi:MaoC family dehydratase [Micromonospora sp. NPDC051006]|uniref:MaoC family dehydratase n=1 Tax=Micromonospora sp. NPDC051006 TaxID=3364283 RepID=UPI003794007E